MKKDNKKERTKFCWNCLYYENHGEDPPCKTCFGITNTGEYYCYRNWKEGVDYVE